MSYAVGIVGRVRATHVMPGMPLPEGAPHSHDYRIEVSVERESLDAEGMVVDIDVLRGALSTVIDAMADADLGDVLDTQEAVTVERLARWVHARLADALGLHAAEMTVRVWEAPDAFGAYRELSR
ncbi:MAG: 6-pyruvoyl trahydropterin synthase family protein [Actinomycetota bacterium]|jgi:6-pyruvoyltetrahydropterin/6-carboxytetrahydropterin synthase